MDGLPSLLEHARSLYAVILALLAGGGGAVLIKVFVIDRRKVPSEIRASESLTEKTIAEAGKLKTETRVDLMAALEEQATKAIERHNAALTEIDKLRARIEQQDLMVIGMGRALQDSNRRTQECEEGREHDRAELAKVKDQVKILEEQLFKR